MCAFEANGITGEVIPQKAEWPRFHDIPEPRMVCLYSGNGSGSKVYQSFFDGHPEIYMVPAYPLMYLYPHWEQWRDELRDNWNWAAIIDIFCTKHATVIDTRRIQSFDGMTKLGDNQDQYLSLDETFFRFFLSYLLEDQVICTRTFLLAIHYAYAYCRHEDLKGKKVLIYHIHVPWYVTQYLSPDFPDMMILGLVRDPRANFPGRHSSNTSGDFTRLNKTDAIIYQQQAYYFSLRYLLEGVEVLEGIPLDRIKMIRHEDLHYKLEDVMKTSALFMGISYHPCLTKLTFGGLAWWGDPVYNMPPMNIVNPRIISLAWKEKISKLDWYVIDGLMFYYLKHYGYEPVMFKSCTFLNLCLLFIAMFLPSKTERNEFWKLVRFSGIKEFYRACVDEATGRAELKDYGFNAFYRHKWTHKHLRLWQPRWYAKILFAARQSNVTMFKIVAQIAYVTANLFRFLKTAAFYPLIIFRRWSLSFRAFNRLRKRSNVLPDLLP